MVVLPQFIENIGNDYSNIFSTIFINFNSMQSKAEKVLISKLMSVSEANHLLCMKQQKEKQQMHNESDFQ
jgi:hypothetical protein